MGTYLVPGRITTWDERSSPRGARQRLRGRALDPDREGTGTRGRGGGSSPGCDLAVINYHKQLITFLSDRYSFYEHFDMLYVFFCFVIN